MKKKKQTLHAIYKAAGKKLPFTVRWTPGCEPGGSGALRPGRSVVVPIVARKRKDGAWTYIPGSKTGDQSADRDGFRGYADYEEFTLVGRAVKKTKTQSRRVKRVECICGSKAVGVRSHAEWCR